MSTKIEVINQDLTTKEGWEEYLQCLQKEKADQAKHGELVLMETILVIVNDPVTEEVFPRPSLAILGTVFNAASAEEAEEQKDRFAGICASMAILGRSIASINFSESWFLSGEAGRKAHESGIRPSEHPDRQEGLSLMTYHRDFGAGFYQALITPKTKRRRKIGPWENNFAGKDPKDAGMSGRFAAFVPPPARANDPAARALAKLCLSMQEEFMLMFKPKKDEHVAQG